MAEDDKEGREFAPSQRRLDQARERGDLPRSEELQTAVAFAGFTLLLAVMGPWSVDVAGMAAVEILRLPQVRPEAERLLALCLAIALPFLGLLLGPALGVLAWLVASRGLVFAPSKLELKFNRLSPLANARQKFGRSGLMDFLRRCLKLVAIGLALGWYLRSRLDQILGSHRLEPGPIAVLLVELVMGFLLLSIGLALAIGILDFLWQRYDFTQRNRMTRKELTDEMKESEGDPQMKADRRRRAQEIANRRMLQDVAKADVVIVNPTHYAVALTWERNSGRTPRCVAKGVDEMALRIRTAAVEAGVPLRHDPPTARMLHASLDIGSEIRREHFLAVAAAIRFADRLRTKARGRRIL